MAYVNSSRPATSGFGDRIAGLRKSLRQALDRRRIYLRTLHELNSLSDRDLADFGVSRGSITDLARQAAYGK